MSHREVYDGRDETLAVLEAGMLMYAVQSIPPSVESLSELTPVMRNASSGHEGADAEQLIADVQRGLRLETSQLF